MITYGVIGAGGFGREVMPLLRSSAPYAEQQNFVFVVEDEYSPSFVDVNGYKVLSLKEFLALPGEKSYAIAIGDSATRERICNEIPREMAQPFSIFSETFISLDNNEIGPGAIFANFTHVTSNAKIGKQFHCNIYSYVAHDVIIGDYVTFAPGVKCNGNVLIEDYAYIGTGAIIKNGDKSPVRIGKGAIVGMGAVVTKSVPAGAVVVGNPAKPFKRN